MSLGRPDWPAGSILHRGGDAKNLRVVRVVVAPDYDQLDVLVVEAV